MDAEEFGIKANVQNHGYGLKQREYTNDNDNRRERLRNLDPEERIAEIKAMKELDKQRELERKHEEVTKMLSYCIYCMQINYCLDSNGS